MIFRSGDNPEAGPGYDGVNTARQTIPSLEFVRYTWLSVQTSTVRSTHLDTTEPSARVLDCSISKASRENGIHWKITVERALKPSIIFLLFGDAKNFLSYPI